MSIISNLTKKDSGTMLSDVVRFFYQYRTIYYYIVPVVWIVVLLAGMYKYTTRESTNVISDAPKKGYLILEYPQVTDSDIELKKSYRHCNAPNDIELGSEGNVEGNVTLDGILILIRHGDRGPLSHVKNINDISCSGDISTNPELQTIYRNYINFLQNVTLYSRAAWSQFLGPFHGFPVIPSETKLCELAQLTNIGIGQLLKTGLLLRQAYYKKMNLENSTLTNKDVIVYSTRYRRTVQSAVALLYAFFENEIFDKFVKISLRESQSYSFCYSDCTCPAAERYHRMHLKEMVRQLQKHSTVLSMIKETANVVFDIPEQVQASINDPHILQDALLTYLCHNGTLPCIDYYFLNQKTCVKNEQVENIFAYTEWRSRQCKLYKIHKKYGMLRAYGLLRNLVSHMLHIISEGKPKIVLYSGHSKTLEYLAIALDIFFDYTTSLLYYASRFIVEIYKANVTKSHVHEASDFYFRILVNGKDVTHKIPFCKGSNYYTANYSRQKKNKEIVKNESILCPIETIIRLLHDDYFTLFNATNFKDACTVHERKP